MALLTCPDCGGNVSSRAPACPHCGCPVEQAAPATPPPAAMAPPARLPEPPPALPVPEAVAAPDEPPAMPLEILTHGGMSTIPLNRRATVGRSKANILVEHQDIAPTHCRVEPADGAWRIVDLADRGVWFGGERVTEVELHAGEVADLGGFPGAVALAMPCALAEGVPLRLRSPNEPESALVMMKLPLVLGRASWADLPLPDRNVSHVHARLRMDRGRIVLDDLGSRNGTMVNGQPAQTGHELRHGDRIVLGETEVLFGRDVVPVAVPAHEPAPEAIAPTNEPITAPTLEPVAAPTEEPVTAPTLEPVPSAPAYGAASTDPGSVVVDQQMVAEATRAETDPAMAPAPPATPSPAVTAAFVAYTPAADPESLPFPVTPEPAIPRSEIVTRPDAPQVFLPEGLSLEQLDQPPAQHVHVPLVRNQHTQMLKIDDDACPACGDSFFLAPAGVMTNALRLVRRKSQASVGRCSSCGARIATCPECNCSNTVTSLFEKIVCRRCGDSFAAG